MQCFIAITDGHQTFQDSENEVRVDVLGPSPHFDIASRTSTSSSVDQRLNSISS